MILDRLTDKLRAAFPNQRFVVDLKPRARIIIPAAHPDVGQIEILDDGDELTLIAGRFTHGHFSCYDDSLSDKEKAEEIAEHALDFLSALFADHVVLWGSHRGAGGWYRLDHGASKPPKQATGLYVWSGPLKSPSSA